MKIARKDHRVRLMVLHKPNHAEGDEAYRSERLNCGTSGRATGDADRDRYDKQALGLGVGPPGLHWRPIGLMCTPQDFISELKDLQVNPAGLSGYYPS